MNQQKANIEEMKAAGRQFWDTLKWSVFVSQADKFRDTIEAGAFKPLGSILRSALTQSPYDPKALEALQRYLNFPVVVKAKGSSFEVEGNPLRAFSAVQVRFIQFIETDPSLRPHSPIGVCPKCAALFLRKRSGQEFCSDKCRFALWHHEKARENPHYWRDKARDSRKAKSRMRDARYVGKVKENNSRKAGKQRERSKQNDISHKRRNPRQ